MHHGILLNKQDVAIKIQYPGVAIGIQSDIENLVGIMKVQNNNISNLNKNLDHREYCLNIILPYKYQILFLYYRFGICFQKECL